MIGCVVQACGEVYAKFAAKLPQEALVSLLDLLQAITQGARETNVSAPTRCTLCLAQEREQVRRLATHLPSGVDGVQPSPGRPQVGR